MVLTNVEENIKLLFQYVVQYVFKWKLRKKCDVCKNILKIQNIKKIILIYTIFKFTVLFVVK